MITFLPDASGLITLPGRVEIDGQAYALRWITAGRIAAGDYVVTRDYTGPVATAYASRVIDASTARSGHGRSYVPAWRRRVLLFAVCSVAIPGVAVTPDWMRCARSSDAYACADRLPVYRPVRVRPSCTMPATHHSADIIAVYHGAAEPLHLCGYHAQDIPAALRAIRAAR